MVEQQRSVHIMAEWLIGRHKIIRLKFRSRIILREVGCSALPRMYGVESVEPKD